MDSLSKEMSIRRVGGNVRRTSISSSWILHLICFPTWAKLEYQQKTEVVSKLGSQLELLRMNDLWNPENINLLLQHIFLKLNKIDYYLIYWILDNSTSQNLHNIINKLALTCTKLCRSCSCFSCIQFGSAGNLTKA